MGLTACLLLAAAFNFMGSSNLGLSSIADVQTNEPLLHHQEHKLQPQHHYQQQQPSMAAAAGGAGAGAGAGVEQQEPRAYSTPLVSGGERGGSGHQSPQQGAPPQEPTGTCVLQPGHQPGHQPGQQTTRSEVPAAGNGYRRAAAPERSYGGGSVGGGQQQSEQVRLRHMFAA